MVSRAYAGTLSQHHSVFIYARGGEQYGRGDSWWDGPNVYWSTPRPGKPVTYIDPQEFERWLLQTGVDIVIFNEQHWWPPVIQCRELGVVVGSYVDYYRRDTVSLFGLYDFLLCNTLRHYSVFKQHEGSCHIPWGTDCDLFRPRDRFPADPITFFHSAGLSPYRKGTDLVLRAFKEVTGDARLIVHFQSAEETTVEARVAASLDRRISIVEDMVPPPGLYHLGDVYVYPARLDGIGLSVPEAMACGLPVIGTASPPMSEFIEPSGCGAAVRVQRYKQRADRYYWPEAEISLQDLTAAMREYVVAPHLAQVERQVVRQFAVQRLNWRTNSAWLPEWISTREPRALDEKLFRRLARRVRGQESQTHTASPRLARIWQRLKSRWEPPLV